MLFSAAAESDWNVAMESTELASIILALAVGNVFSYVSHQNAFKNQNDLENAVRVGYPVCEQSFVEICLCLV